MFLILSLRRVSQSSLNLPGRCVQPLLPEVYVLIPQVEPLGNVLEPSAESLLAFPGRCVVSEAGLIQELMFTSIQLSRRQSVPARGRGNRQAQGPPLFQLRPLESVAAEGPRTR